MAKLAKYIKTADIAENSTKEPAIKNKADSLQPFTRNIFNQGINSFRNSGGIFSDDYGADIASNDENLDLILKRYVAGRTEQRVGNYTSLGSMGALGGGLGGVGVAKLISLLAKQKKLSDSGVVLGALTGAAAGAGLATHAVHRGYKQYDSLSQDEKREILKKYIDKNNAYHRSTVGEYDRDYSRAATLYPIAGLASAGVNIAAGLPMILSAGKLPEMTDDTLKELVGGMHFGDRHVETKKPEIDRTSLFAENAYFAEDTPEAKELSIQREESKLRSKKTEQKARVLNKIKDRIRVLERHGGDEQTINRLRGRYARINPENHFWLDRAELNDRQKQRIREKIDRRIGKVTSVSKRLWKPGIMAHELGHAEIAAGKGIPSFLQKHLYGPTAIANQAGVGIIPALGAYKLTERDDNEFVGGMKGLALGSAVNAGILVPEFEASRRGIRSLMRTSLPTSLKLKNALTTVPAFLTYLSFLAGPSAVLGAVHAHMNKRRKQKEQTDAIR
jgi:hypothetical protein